ncbi:MAG TPA: Rpn family recombination-promoting nuclease/putative transposase [Sporosarcina sp.]|nr:Rpn family recombination-promoting nuclease/putative transposase [Sporosarcina sp.]
MEEEAPYVVDQDGLWKKAIHDLFDDFLFFFVPDFYEQVNFSSPPEFLDKELFQEVVDTKTGRRFTDQLVKVRLKNGAEQWVLVHVEVQSRHEKDFSTRMFQYFYRIFDRYDEKIIAIAVHTSPNDNPYPKDFDYNFFDMTLLYSYYNFSTKDYSPQQLTYSKKVFSKIILAANMMHVTADAAEQRYRFKRQLMRDILEEGYDRTVVQATFHFIDYCLALPEQLTEKLSTEMRHLLRRETDLMELYNKENASPTVLKSFAEQLEEAENLVRQANDEAENKSKMQQIEIAKALIQENIAIDVIVKATKLSVDEVRRLQEDVK